MKKAVKSILSYILCIGVPAYCMLCIGILTFSSRTLAAENSGLSVEASPAEAVPAEPASAETVSAGSASTEAVPAESASVQADLNEFSFGGDRFVGEWSDEYSERAFMTVVPTDYYGVYTVTLHWGDTAATFYQWDMTASYDEAAGSIQYTDGSRSYVTLYEDAPEESVLEWEGSEGCFYFEEEMLLWEDSKEETAEDVRFVKVTTCAPTAAELAEGFFRPAAHIPADADDAVFREAQTACDMLRFAKDHVIWCSDPDELRTNLAEAWDNLSAGEQAAVDENLFALHGLVVDSVVDWTDYEYLFEENGIADEMKALESDKTVLEGFTRLFDNTVAVCLASQQPSEN